MLCMPACEKLTCASAVPELKLIVARGVAPSLNVTDPVADDGKTFAVRVTDWLSAGER